MKLIQLTQGKFTEVDDDLFDYLNQWKWYLNEAGKSRGKTYYACRKIRVNGKDVTVRMHNVIWNLRYGTAPKLLDHKDGRGWNNQTDNLRESTISQNQTNRPAMRNNLLGIKGIRRRGNRFRARINKDGKEINLGTFNTIEEAIAAYKDGAAKYHGEFARLD